ncbi:hypothetical protein ACIRPK_35430 [Kitasatospora sp. NPDC101801]|uniref:hypothetical protein n=1 Tax=Kitasatospora sp. NPDC101801 TaxID=3364103 RepID=UPI00380CE473
MEAALTALAPRLQLAQPSTMVPVLPASPGSCPPAITGGGTALMLALTAAATAAGTWCATVGLDQLGLLAAADFGVALKHLLAVEDAGDQWAAVATALADGVGLLLLRRRRVPRIRRFSGGVPDGGLA